MELTKQYYTFISYKREEMKETKRLQPALEFWQVFCKYYLLLNHLL